MCLPRGSAAVHMPTRWFSDVLDDEVSLIQGERRYRWAQWWQLPCLQVIPHGVPVSTDLFKMRIQVAAFFAVTFAPLL